MQVHLSMRILIPVDIYSNEKEKLALVGTLLLCKDQTTSSNLQTPIKPKHSSFSLWFWCLLQWLGEYWEIEDP